MCKYVQVSVLYKAPLWAGSCPSCTVSAWGIASLCACLWELCALCTRAWVLRSVRGFWWQFPYCLGSCGHRANSWCCGCPLRRGEIKAGAWYHKGACLVLFNSPKLGHDAKAAPCYGKHSITGTTTAAQQDMVSERDIELWKKTFTCFFPPLSAHLDTGMSKACIHVISGLWLLLVCRDIAWIHYGSLLLQPY